MCVETTQVTQQIRGGRPLGAGTTGGGGCWGVLWWGGRDVRCRDPAGAPSPSEGDPAEHPGAPCAPEA